MAITNLPDPIPTTDSITSAVLGLVRDHGLVVFAIAALMWQVWYLGNMLQANEERWRSTVSALQAQIGENARLYQTATTDLANAIARLTEVSRVTEMIISSVEEECLRQQTVDELQKEKGAAP
jgi:hypothetical protein